VLKKDCCMKYINVILYLGDEKYMQIFLWKTLKELET